MQDDDIDVEDDPEIQAILASAISKNASGSYSQGLDSFDARSPFADAISPRSPEEGEDAEMARLKVHWLGESFGDGRTKWTFGFMLVGISYQMTPQTHHYHQDAPFRRLNEMMRAKTGRGEEDIVLVYDKQRIMLGATPRSLRIKKDMSTKIG